MRILQVHNFYQQGGGEDVVVSNEQSLLRDHGHETRLFSVSNDDIVGFAPKLVAAWQSPYSPGAKIRLAQEIASFTPDIVHVHNFFPLLTPAVYDACRDAGVPVVQTLHNYRTICAAALLMRDGKPCEDCIKGTPYQAVRHGCYRGSRLGSLAVARMIDTHRHRGTWATKVDRLVALTEFAKEKFVEAGFPPEKIAVKSNFVKWAEPETPVDANRHGALFVGRLSQEKGIETLLRAWKSLDVPLHLVGDGPLLELVKGEASETITVLGKRDPKQVMKEMADAAFLIMPSECYEGFPLVLVEAFAQGLPVIASRLGAMAEIVEDGVTGLHFAPGDAEDLADKVRWAAEHIDEMREMGANARRVYEEKYTPEINYRQLMAIYQAAIEENKKHTV